MRRKSVTTYTERSGERLVIRDLVKLFRPAGRCVVRDRRSRQTYIVEATRHEDGTVFETPLRLTAAGRDPKLSDMQQSPAPSKRRRFTAIILGAAVVVALLVGGTVWVGAHLADQLGAPGIPGATGSGPCGSADAVNVELVYAAQSVRACTRQRPVCKNPNPSRFTFDNQLRSSSRRYILFIQFDAVFPADMPQQTVQLDPAALLLPKSPADRAAARVRS